MNVWRLVAIGIGGYLLWFGVSHFGDGTSPAAPLRSLFQGKGI